MTRENLILDLDNTLYPESWGLMQTISDRMVQFIYDKFSGSEHDASARIKHYRSSFNSLAVGVYQDFRSEFSDFLSYSHKIDLSPFTPPLQLKNLLDKSGFRRKFIFSNAPKSHVLNILEKFKISHEFEIIFSIEDTNYNYKPSKLAFELFYNAASIDPRNSVFVDDCADNIQMAKKFGCHTVLIHEHPKPASYSDERHSSIIDYFQSHIKTN